MNDVVPNRLPPVVPPTGGSSIFASPADFEFAQRIGRVFSEAMLVPEHLRGKLADCVLAYGIAKRLNEDPLMVMQNIYFVHGRAGWNTQYMISRANRSGTFRGPLRWETRGQGDTLSVTCYAYLSHVEEGDDPRVEITVTMAMARADGWTRNDKYKSLPEQMLRWRSAAWLIRLYCPEVMMGYPAADELEDRDNAWAGPIDVTPQGPRPELHAFKPGEVIEGEAKPANEDEQPVPESPKPPPPPETQAASPPLPPEPEKPKRGRPPKVLQAQTQKKPPEPQLPPEMEPYQGDELPPEETAPPPPYDVLVPPSTSLQAWFKPAKDKLTAMLNEKRPREDFLRFRAENKAMLTQMQEGFGFWFNSLNAVIAQGERM